MCARESRLVFFFSVYQLSKAKPNQISIAFDTQVKTKNEIKNWHKSKGKNEKKNCINLNDIS